MQKHEVYFINGDFASRISFIRGYYHRQYLRKRIEFIAIINFQQQI